MAGYVEMLLGSKSKPVFILNNTDNIRKTIQRKALNDLVLCWRAISFIFIGDKRVNDLHSEGKNDFVECAIDT